MPEKSSNNEVGDQLVLPGLLKFGGLKEPALGSVPLIFLPNLKRGTVFKRRHKGGARRQRPSCFSQTLVFKPFELFYVFMAL